MAAVLVNSQTVNEVTTLSIASGLQVSQFSVLERVDGSEKTFFLITDDSDIHQVNSVASASKLDSPLALKCYSGSNMCLTAGNLEVRQVEYSGTEFEQNTKPYKFLKEFKQDKSILNMELEPIQGT
jgi:hypothetical protein